MVADLTEPFDGDYRGPVPPVVPPLPKFDIDVQAKADELLLARRRKAALLDWHQQMPVDFQDATWANLVAGARDDHERAAIESLDRFCRDPRPFCVMLGKRGAGKSFAGCAVAHRFADERGWLGKFWPVTEFFTELKTFGDRGHGAMALAASVNVLVLDDLCSGRSMLTEYEADQMNALLNRRWMERLPTIITSNLDKDDGPDGPGFKTVVGPRIADRLLDGHPPLLMLGATRRGQRASAGR